MKLDSLFGSFEELNGNLSEPFNDIEPVKKLPELDLKRAGLQQTGVNISLPKIDSKNQMNGKKAVNYLMTKHGLPRHIAAAAIGNAMQESGLNPNAVNKQSGAYGLFQWLGGRKTQYINKYGKNPTFENQLDFMVEELNTTESKAKKKLYETKDPITASTVFANDFERMGKHEANYQRRNSNTMAVYKKGGFLCRPKYALGADVLMQLGSGLNNLIGEGIDSLDNDQPYSNKWNSTASGFFKGNAQLPGIGGIIGGISGFVNAQKEKEKYEQEERDKNANYLKAARIKSMMSTPNTNKNVYSFYEKGGQVDADYEVEKDEVVTGNPTLSDSEEIAEGIHKVKGYTHDEINPKTGTTGVLGTGGDKVFSNSIYFNNGKSIADAATDIAKKINKEEKKMKSKIGVIGRQTAMLNKIKLENQLEELFGVQEESKINDNQQVFKYGGLLEYQKGGKIPFNELQKQEKIIKDRLLKIENELKGRFSNPDIPDALKREARTLKLKLSNVGKSLSSRAANVNPNAIRPDNIINKTTTKIGNVINKTQNIANKIKLPSSSSLGKVSAYATLATEMQGDVNPNMSINSKPIEKPIDAETLKQLKKEGFNFDRKYQTGVYNPTDVNGNSIIPNKRTLPTPLKKPYTAPTDLINVSIPETPKPTRTGTGKINKTPQLTPQQLELAENFRQQQLTQKIEVNPIKRNFVGTDVKPPTPSIIQSKVKVPTVETSANKDYDWSKLEDFSEFGVASLGNLANYIGVNNRLNKIKTNVPVNLIGASPYMYADRSGMNRSIVNQSLRNITNQSNISPQAKQNMYANYLKGMNEVENNERNAKLSYDSDYSNRQWQIDAQNQTILSEAQRQKIANQNLVNSQKTDNFNNLFQNTNTALGEMYARRNDKKKMSILSKAYKNTGADVLKILKELGL